MTTTKRFDIKKIFVLFAILTALLPVRSAFALCECEPNDNFGTADAIQMGKVVYGDIEPGSCWEDDYYKVNSPIAGTATLVFVNDYPDRWSSSFDIYTYDKYYRNASLFNEHVRCDTTVPHRFTIKLNRGMNYIRVKGTDADPNLREYHFKLSYYTPKTTARVSSPAKKTVKVTWKKKAAVTAYQIRYSTKKSMSGAKIITVAKSRSTRSIKVGKSKKVYYVQVRTVKKVGNVKYYSAWSAKRAVRTK